MNHYDPVPDPVSSPADGCTAARASASPATSSTIARASSGVTSVAPERQHVRAVVLARVAGDGLGRRTSPRGCPRILFAAIADPMPAPSMTMPASASRRATVARHRARRRPDSPPARVPSVPRSSTARPRPRRNATSVAPQLHAGVIAGDRDRPDVRGRRQAGLVDRHPPLVDDRDAARLERVGGERRDVAAPGQRHRLAARRAPARRFP